MIIAYLRVSTGRQHLENQEREIKHYAKSKNLIIDRWVTEIVSGKTERKNRLLGSTVRKLKKGDILIVTELSRLSRSLHEIMEIMKLCIDSSVTVHSTKDGYVFVRQWHFVKLKASTWGVKKAAVRKWNI